MARDQNALTLRLGVCRTEFLAVTVAAGAWVISSVFSRDEGTALNVAVFLNNSSAPGKLTLRLIWLLLLLLVHGLDDDKTLNQYYCLHKL